MTQAIGSSSGAGAARPLDLANALQRAVGELQAVIDGKPETDRLLAEMVRICGEALQAGGAGVWVTQSPDKPELVLEHNLAILQILAEGATVKGVVTAVRRCAREGKPLVVPPLYSEEHRREGDVAWAANPCALELLFVPVRLHGKVELVLLLAVPVAEGDDSQHRTYLNFLMRPVNMLEQTLSERHVALLENDMGRSGKLLRFAQHVHQHLFVGPVAADIANLARDVLAAQRVTVELYPRRRKRVVAVSNVDAPNGRGTIMQVQRLIFDYTRDRQVAVVMDREAAKQLVSDPLLQDATAAYFVASPPGTLEAFAAVPIKGDDPASPVMGVILAEFASAELAQAHSGLLDDVARLSVEAVGHALELGSLPLVKTFYTMRRAWKAPLSFKRMAAVAAGALLLAAVVALAVVPCDFAIKADCQIRPRAQLSIVAPLSGLMVNVPVRAGEHVYPASMRGELGEKVKPLAVFDSMELASQRATAVGKLGALRVDLEDAKKKNDYAKISALGNELESVRSEIRRIEHQIELCTVWSPIEGTVLTENVEQKQYSTPRQGEDLMEVASFADWELVVDVPESDVAAVREALEAGRPGVNGIEMEYILYPWPETRYAIPARGMATLLPAAQQSQSHNVFRLQVKLDPGSLPQGIAMSGVTGRAKIHLGSQPLLAQWTRGAWRMLKMTVLF